MDLEQIDFSGWQMKSLLFGLIHQTILPFNEKSMNISVGDKMKITFDSVPFKNYFLLVTNVTFTDLSKISNKDMFENGFIYKPSFISFMKDFRNIDEGSSVVKVDFKLRECDEYV